MKVDPRVSDSLREIEEYWTLDDVLDCHLVLDALDEAQDRAAERVRAESRRPR